MNNNRSDRISGSEIGGAQLRVGSHIFLAFYIPKINDILMAEMIIWMKQWWCLSTLDHIRYYSVRRDPIDKFKEPKSASLF